MNDNPTYCSTFNVDASETVAYNNPLFPAYIRHEILSTYPDYSAVSHWHKDLEFIAIKTGRMTYNVNGNLIELTEGNGIMINSRQLHYGFSSEHQECEFICILFSPELLSGNQWFYQNYIEPITENSLYPYLYLGVETWENAILKKLDETIVLDDIASAGACCKSRCSLLFKKYLRETPMTYIAKLRLRKSLAALLDSDKNITEIAYEYGFCGASYYCETFQKYYGISPLKYRKTQK